MADNRNRLIGINLNLFVVLAALLEHRSATRAAAELRVTPSAVSHSLRELRRLLDDPLFVRSGAGLVPTERARALETELSEALGGLGRVVQREHTFDPAESTRHITIATADDAGMTALPAMVSRVSKAAPGMTLDIRHRSGRGLAPLEAHRVDLLIQLADSAPGWAAQAPLYSDTMACLVRADHPQVGDVLTLDQFRRLSHIRISPEGYGPSHVDDMLTRAGVERHVSVYTWSFLMAPELVAGTDAILTMPSRMARIAASRLGLKVFEPPLPLPGFTIAMYWHRGRDDHALKWLRGQLRAGMEASDE